MAYTGITTRETTCAICNKSMPKGELVYFDSSKRQGKHLAHKSCYDDLRKSRDKQPPYGKVILSSEPLDPPF